MSIYDGDSIYNDGTGTPGPPGPPGADGAPGDPGPPGPGQEYPLHYRTLECPINTQYQPANVKAATIPRLAVVPTLFTIRAYIETGNPGKGIEIEYVGQVTPDGTTLFTTGRFLTNPSPKNSLFDPNNYIGCRIDNVGPDIILYLQFGGNIDYGNDTTTGSIARFVFQVVESNVPMASITHHEAEAWGTGSPGVYLRPQPYERVYISPNDASPGYLYPKIQSSDGSVIKAIINPGVDEELDLRTAATSSGAPNGQQLWDAALNEFEGWIGQGGAVNSGPSNGTRAFFFIANRTLNITRMRIWCTQISGALMRLCIYDLSGNLLAQTAQFNPVVGINDAPLLAPLMFTGGFAGYMGYWAQDAGGNDRFFLVTGKSTASSAPLMQRSDPNETPGVIGTGMSNTDARPWIMISEA